MVLGAISIDGHLLYQVLHGNSTPSLVSTDHLLSADFVQGWRIEGTSALVKIRVGSAILQLKSLYHNFLEVKPDQRVECVFSLKNVGTSTLLLEKPQVSCSCIETGDSQPSSIAPNDTKTLSVALHPKGSFHHAVALTLFDKGSPVPRRVTLDLLGVTRASMKITPKAVDFGVVVPGSSISRTVLLTEVPTDRFSILTVDTGSLPITWKTEESKDNNGLSSYLLRLGLNVAQACPHDTKARLSSLRTVLVDLAWRFPLRSTSRRMFARFPQLCHWEQFALAMFVSRRYSSSRGMGCQSA